MSDKQEKQEPESLARENGAKDPSGMVTVDVASYTRMVRECAEADARADYAQKICEAASMLVKEQTQEIASLREKIAKQEENLAMYRAYLKDTRYRSDYLKWRDRYEQKKAEAASKESEAE